MEAEAIAEDPLTLTLPHQGGGDQNGPPKRVGPSALKGGGDRRGPPV